jgi:hypothetical protein
MSIRTAKTTTPSATVPAPIPDPAKVYVCANSFCCEAYERGEVVIPRGTRLYGDHAAVLANPTYWVEDGMALPTVESFAGLDQHADTHVTRLPRTVDEMDDSECVIATRKVVTSAGALPGGWTAGGFMRIIEPGTRLDKRDPAVVENPRSFKPAG